MSKQTDLDEQRAQMIEDMLLYLGLHTRGLGCPDPMFFDNALPSNGTMFRHVLDSAGKSVRALDDKATALSRIEGVAMFPSEHDKGYTLIGCRPLDVHARKRLFFTDQGILKPVFGARVDITDTARQNLTLLTPILQVRQVIIDANGQGVAKPPGYMFQPTRMAGKWMEMIRGDIIGDMSLAWLGYCIGVGVSVSMTTSWSVNLKFEPASPGLCFVTDPTGVRDFFRFRDVPEGKARRSALVNWVHEHWRVSRHDPEDEIYVREHLRGARDFSWRSLAGSIHIPEADVKREEEAKEKRKRMPAHELIRRRKMQR